MEYLEIEGSGPLRGEVRIQGSKNAALPILAAAVLYPGVTVLHNCPRISDVENMLAILKGLGCRVDWKEETLAIDAAAVRSGQVPEQYATRMRSSLMLLGSLLGRTGKAQVPYPGGCIIGKRPINIHVEALRQMGAEVTEGATRLTAVCRKAKGAVVYLPFPSVGATENVLLTAVLADGLTLIGNAAKEPEIVELCRFLSCMGAKIRGAGTSQIVVSGVKKLTGTEFTIVSDRIVAGTYMLLTAVLGGSVLLKNPPLEHLTAVSKVLRRMGVHFEHGGDGTLLLGSSGNMRAVPLVRTEPYPGFPTDLQSPLLAALCLAKGESVIEETIFEARFKIVDELWKMGADLYVDNRRVCIRGVAHLCGGDLEARELRGSAALVLAAAAAEGRSRIFPFTYLERGYENIIGDLQGLGVMVNLREENG